MKSEKIYITPRCPIRTTLELVGGKWKLLILQQLCNHQELRPSKLKKLIPDISEKMLIQELKNLVESGLAQRKDYEEVPARVEYSITEKGRHAQPLIMELVKFARLYEE